MKNKMYYVQTFGVPCGWFNVNLGTQNKNEAEKIMKKEKEKFKAKPYRIVEFEITQ